LIEYLDQTGLPDGLVKFRLVFAAQASQNQPYFVLSSGETLLLAPDACVLNER
jgi:hypothetical protein